MKKKIKSRNGIAAFCRVSCIPKAVPPKKGKGSVYKRNKRVEV